MSSRALLTLTLPESHGSQGLQALAILSELAHSGFAVTVQSMDGTLLFSWERRFLPIEHVAIQAILGSDFRRETLNLMRVLSEPRGAGRKRWNILYEHKLHS